MAEQRQNITKIKYNGASIGRSLKASASMNTFHRSDHVYVSPDFDEVIKDTIRFFNGTPVHPVPIPERFHGTGVYALYSIAKSGIYSKFHSVNRTEFRMPIYVGKAVPKGWRQARLLPSTDTKVYELNNRIKEHSRSIEIGDGLNLSDFFCRFMIPIVRTVFRRGG